MASIASARIKREFREVVTSDEVIFFKRINLNEKKISIN